MYCPKCSHDKMIKSGVTVGAGKPRYTCKGCGFLTTSPLGNKPTILPKTNVTSLKRENRYLITSAVCDTPLVKGALDVFLEWCKHNDATLVVVPTVYKNPNAMTKGNFVEATWWPEEILPYVCTSDFNLNKNICLKANTSIQHTAINPLSGMNNAGTMISEIYGHAQIAMEMVATSKEDLPKMMVTTGTLSKKNYGQSKSAKKAEFHHTIGALIVETQGDKFWTRQFIFDGKGAYDLDKYYSNGRVSGCNPVAALVYGDIHARALKAKTEKTFREVREFLKPDINVYHDVYDHHAQSHHAVGNVIAFLLDPTMLNVREELDITCKWLDMQPDAHVVDSNHDRHLNQWFNRFKPQHDPLNADLYFELAEMLRVQREGNLFKLYVDRYCSNTVTFLSCNKKFMVKGIDLSQHGDKGPNGSRGSAKGLSKSGLKSIIGHSHTPCIEKGTYQVGTSSMDMEYANGRSSWAMAHCIIYENGKRSLFFIVHDKLSPMMRTV